MRRTIVYIDGYNWYHAIFKHRPEWKWLNIRTFFKGLRPHDEIVAIKLFSALMPDALSRERQEKYFLALKEVLSVEVILGFFQEREVTCRSQCGNKYLIHDEKKTDVNIALAMLGDAISGACNQMVVVSGDSDAQPAVEWVCNRHPEIKVIVYVPCLPPERPFRRTDYYRNKGLSVDCQFLPLDNLKDHQLPNAVRRPGEEVRFLNRPHTWRATN